MVLERAKGVDFGVKLREQEGGYRVAPHQRHCISRYPQENNLKSLRRIGYVLWAFMSQMCLGSRWTVRE